MDRKQKIRDEIFAQKLEDKPYEVIAKYFNDRPLIENPNKQGVVPMRVTLADAFDVMEPADVMKIVDEANPQLLKWIEEACLRDDKQAINKYMMILAAKGWLSQTSKQALEALMQRTQPDPTWQSHVFGESIGESLGVGHVTTIDIQDALN